MRLSITQIIAVIGKYSERQPHPQNTRVRVRTHTHKHTRTHAHMHHQIRIKVLHIFICSAPIAVADVELVFVRDC